MYYLIFGVDEFINMIKHLQQEIRMKKIFGYIGPATDTADKQDFNRQYRSIKALAANNGMEKVQFVIELDSEQVSSQKKELKNLLSSRIQSGDILITELPTLGSSMLDIVEVLTRLAQKRVTVYCLPSPMLLHPFNHHLT